MIGVNFTLSAKNHEYILFDYHQQGLMVSMMVSIAFFLIYVLHNKRLIKMFESGLRTISMKIKSPQGGFFLPVVQ